MSLPALLQLNPAAQRLWATCSIRPLMAICTQERSGQGKQTKRKAREPRNKQILSDFNVDRASYLYSFIILAGRVRVGVHHLFVEPATARFFWNCQIGAGFNFWIKHIKIKASPRGLPCVMEIYDSFFSCIRFQKWRSENICEIWSIVENTGFHHQVLPSKKF